LGLLRGRLGVGAAHSGDDFLIAGGRRGGVGIGGDFGEEPALDDAEDFVAFDWFAHLILARGDMVECVEQARVFQGLPRLA
jgi:hypothetical protein